MLIPLLAGGAVLAVYLYEKSHQNALHASEAAGLQAAQANAQAGVPPQPGPYVSPAPVITVPGFNTKYQAQTAPQAPPGTIQYVQATTQTNPSTSSGQNYVARYQAANPIPSDKTYYPAPGDVSDMVCMRLGGTSAARMAGQNKTEVIKSLTVADLGKLNGFVSYSDCARWVKDGKPLKLPTNVNDVAGPVPGAKGQVR